MRFNTKTCRVSKSRKPHFTPAAIAFLLIICISVNATAQSSKQTAEQRNPEWDTATADGVAESPAAAQEKSAPDVRELQLVVVLLRHGVRAPLKNFAACANIHSGQSWPSKPSDWGAQNWGDLTSHGYDLASKVGSHYGKYYKSFWPRGFSAYLWSDTDLRNQDTTKALIQGLQEEGVDVTWSKSTWQTDPLYHPFKAKCGTPDAGQIKNTIAEIDKLRQQPYFKSKFEKLYGLLGCNGPCVPLNKISDIVVACNDKAPCQDKTKAACQKDDSEVKCESPISWCGQYAGKIYSGQYPYASSASEAFLLEYANNMAPVAWGRVPVPPPDRDWNLHDVLQLHDYYFLMTQQRPYIASIQASNLIREILDEINRKAKYKNLIDGECPHGNENNQFIGLVGHDTNIAGVAKLLNLNWFFVDQNLPPDSVNLPIDEALPAGGLVFELLRNRDSGYFVRIHYATQSLSQMNRGSGLPGDDLFRLKVGCRDEKGKSINPCELSLKSFNLVVEKALGKNNQFLSHCEDHQQVCAHE